MSQEIIRTSTIVDAPIETVFDLLADPAQHAAIDGTGWVRGSLDGRPLTQVGQIFRIEMFHDNHPNKVYDISNRVEVLDRPRAIAWQPGQGPDDRGNLMPGADVDFGGWIWRYDLEPAGSGKTTVTLTYDWSGVPPDKRDIAFPPFPVSHLENSLSNLAELAQRG